MLKQIKNRNNRCFYCERQFGTKPHANAMPLQQTKDHVISPARGGVLSRNSQNIVWSCHKCNTSKGNLTPEEYYEKVEEGLSSGVHDKKTRIIVLYNLQRLIKVVNECPHLFFSTRDTTKPTPKQLREQFTRFDSAGENKDQSQEK